MAHLRVNSISTLKILTKSKPMIPLIKAEEINGNSTGVHYK